MIPKNRKTPGFSFIELMVAVAAIGVIAAIAVPAITSVRANAKATKLNNEVTSLNAAVKSFVSSGGQITASDSALDVLELLKAELSAEDKEDHVGYTGSFVDHRLTGEPIGQDEEGTRAVWDFNGKRFVLTDDQVDGIVAFVLDDNAEKSTRTRESISLFKYSDDDESWVWEYGEEGAKVEISPTPVATAPGTGSPDEPILISLVPIDDQTPPDPEVENPPPVDPNRLSPPTFSIGGGNYPLGDYRLGLEIFNPNTDVASSIFYRFGSGSWSEYQEGQPLSITPETEIDAFVFSRDPGAHESSSLASSSYRSDPVQLELSLDSDSTRVSYYDLVDGEVRIRWNVTNLSSIPDYLKNHAFFSTYWTDDSSDPAFGNRNLGEVYTPEYQGESMLLSPSLWEGNDIFEFTAYAESNDSSWIKSSEKPSVSISVKKETLPAPDIELQELGSGKYLVRLTPSADMPPGAQIYYNSTGETMSFDADNGHVAEGTLYNGPFQWEPEIVDDNGSNGGGATGTVNIDRGNGDVPIQQVVLKTNNNLVTQNGSVAFDAMTRPGADTMRGATVVNNSSSEITIESITINDNGNIIVADQVNVLDLHVTNLNYPDENLDRVTVYENGTKLGDANGGNFAEHLETALRSRDLRDYVKYDGNNSLLHGTAHDFDVTFSPLSNNDYLVVSERFGNSTFDLEALDASGDVIAGSNKVVIREYSWNTGYAPSDLGSQPMFLAVIDIEQFGVNTDANSITGFRVNDDGGADFKFFTISDDSFENRPVNYEGDLTAAAYPPAELSNWFSPSSSSSTTVDGEVEVPELENPVEADINFKKLTTSAWFLNEGYLVVNGVEHQFQTSDDVMGGMLDIAAIVDENAINTIDLKIYTTARVLNGNTFDVVSDRTATYNSATDGFKQISSGSGFGGYDFSSAKLRNDSYNGTTRLTFGYEDLHSFDPFGWGSDYDYNDYNFEISMPDWINFEFGGVQFGGISDYPGDSGSSSGSSDSGSSSNSDSSNNNDDSNQSGSYNNNSGGYYNGNSYNNSSRGNRGNRRR